MLDVLQIESLLRVFRVLYPKRHHQYLEEKKRKKEKEKKKKK